MHSRPSPVLYISHLPIWTPVPQFPMVPTTWLALHTSPVSVPVLDPADTLSYIFVIIFYLHLYLPVNLHTERHPEKDWRQLLKFQCGNDFNKSGFPPCFKIAMPGSTKRR